MCGDDGAHQLCAVTVCAYQLCVVTMVLTSCVCSPAVCGDGGNDRPATTLCTHLDHIMHTRIVGGDRITATSRT